MANEFDHKIWGVTDFKRYHNGTMPDQERHALEKASLEDPFLQDALDGYTFAQHPEEDLVAISERIWPVEKTKRTPVIWYKKNTAVLWRVAAIVVVIIGVGWLIINNTNKSSNDQLAAVEKQQSQDVKGDAVPRFDSVIASTKEGNAIASADIPKSAEIAATSPIQQSATPVIPAPEDEAISRVDYDRSAKESPAGLEKAAGEKSPIAPNKNEANYDRYKDANMVAGKVVDQAGNPVPFASVVLQNTQQGVQADANGNFSMRNNNAPSEKLQLQANAVGYETTNIAINNNSGNNNIVLNENNNVVSEVVVTTGLAKKKAARSATSSVSKAKLTKWNASNSKIKIKAAVPINGWEHFYNYMHDSTELGKTKILKQGTVALEFNLDTAGKPTNIRLLKPANAATDSLAKKILVQAPALRLLNNKKPARAEFIFK